MSNIETIELRCACCKDLLSADNAGDKGRCRHCLSVFDALMEGCKARGFVPPDAFVWPKVAMQRLSQKLPQGVAESFTRAAVKATNSETAKIRREIIRRDNKKD
jgi:hypothetical protein